MLSQQQINTIIEIMKPFNPTKIGIFGSAARGEESDKSDIDILYEFESTIGLFKLIRLHNELQEKLHKKVDLVSERYAHPLLKPYIFNDLKIIYGS